MSQNGREAGRFLNAVDRVLETSAPTAQAKIDEALAGAVEIFGDFLPKVVADYYEKLRNEKQGQSSGNG
ncbi:MAG: hypothetical protein ABH826_00605 [Patescibacteria group bacterium]|nr:hypothetical protein [Patescibacteria group bacterium]